MLGEALVDVNKSCLIRLLAIGCLALICAVVGTVIDDAERFLCAPEMLLLRACRLPVDKLDSSVVCRVLYKQLLALLLQLPSGLELSL